jgi:hypothetical protein
LGDFLGDFSLSFGDFFAKISGHPGYHGNVALSFSSLNLGLKFLDDTF